MSDGVIAEILRIAARLRWASFWAGVPPYLREPFILEDWI